MPNLARPYGCNYQTDHSLQDVITRAIYSDLASYALSYYGKIPMHRVHRDGYHSTLSKRVSSDEVAGATPLCPDRRDPLSSWRYNNPLARRQELVRARSAADEERMFADTHQLIERSLRREQRVLIIAADNYQVRSRLRRTFCDGFCDRS